MASRAASVVTMSTSSPSAKVVVGVGTSDSPSRTIRLTTDGAGSRSSEISTPCRREPGGTVSVSSSAPSLSSGAASTWTSRAWSGCVTPSSRAAAGRLGPWTRVNTTTSTNTTCSRSSAPSTPETMGNVASTIGTAPRSPAQDRKSCSRRGTRNHGRHASTETGRATSSSTRPATTPATTASGNWPGSTSRPSITNSPICPSQPVPSAKERLAARCGSLALPSTTPHT